MKFKYPLIYGLAGFVFGSLFVLSAWSIDLWINDLVPTIKNLVQIHKDNPIIFIVDSAPFVLGVFSHFLGQVYQISYDNAETNQNSRVRFKALMDSAFDAIIIMDVSGAVMEFNHAAEAIFGFKEKEIIGSNLASLIIPKDRRDPEITLETLIGRRFETEAMRMDGSKVEVEFAFESHELLVNPSIGSGTVAYVGFVRDITDRKLAEARNLQTSRLETLGEMATAVAHELNQPLNVIRMASGNSRRMISSGKADQDYLLEKLNRIENQTARASSIIAHMRVFERSHHEESSSIIPTDALNIAVHSVFNREDGSENIKVVINAPVNCPSVFGLKSQLVKVFFNIFINSKEAIEKNAIDGKVTISIIVDENHLRILIDDNAGGIADEVLPRIFEPFYTTKDLVDGAGLGLSISYGIIHAMNGKIFAENINQGARISLILPKLGQLGLC